MGGKRRALLIATDAYTDAGLTGLRAPTGDVRALAAVLADRAIGGFDVHELVNRPTDEIKQEIEGFFEDAPREDLLLLYVTGHGVLSPTRRLYFATTTTKLNRLRATAIEDGFVHDVMQYSRARSVVLMLDCCHSGAFARGLAPKSALGVDIAQRFEGQGRVTLTASTALEYAFEESEPAATVSKLGASIPGSLFTRYLVDGLKTGEADIDEDGDVSIDELYDFIYERVRSRSPHQTPGKSGGGHGDIVIATSPLRPTISADVREAIDQALNHPWPAIRETAVGELVRLRHGADRTLAAAIDGALHRALDDDSRRVSASARSALSRGAAVTDISGADQSDLKSGDVTAPSRARGVERPPDPVLRDEDAAAIDAELEAAAARRAAHEAVAERLEEVRRWVREGRSIAWIAHQLDMSTDQVTALVRDHGIERPLDPVQESRNDDAANRQLPTESPFRSVDEFQSAMNQVLRIMNEDSDVGPRLRAANISQRFEFEDARLVVNIRATRPGEEGNLRWEWSDDVDWEPQTQMTMSSETANRYFQGRVNVALALARRRIKSSGDVKAALTLIPITKPVHDHYRRYLASEHPHLLIGGARAGPKQAR